MADLAKIVEDLSSLTVLEAAELAKLLEVRRPVTLRKLLVAGRWWLSAPPRRGGG